MLHLLNMGWGTLPVLLTGRAAMRPTTTSLHLQRHTAGNARPRRSCASHTRRWTGAWYCGADHYQTPFQSHLVEHFLHLTHFPRPRCYEAWRTHLRPLCFEWNPVWLYSRPNPKYEVAHRWSSRSLPPIAGNHRLDVAMRCVIPGYLGPRSLSVFPICVGCGIAGRAFWDIVCAGIKTF